MAFTNGYTALIYGIYYTFFEAFPLVYIGIYGFNLGTMGIVFTCVIVGCVIGIAVYGESSASIDFLLKPLAKRFDLHSRLRSLLFEA